MSTSLNGWRALPDGDPQLVTGTIPGTTRRLTACRAALPLLLHFCAAWNAEMPARLKLDHGPVDGWEYRDARTGGGLSNHASGTAVDLRYDILLADHERHMTTEETAILRRILARYVCADGHHVLANGYAWRVGAYCDEMHTELSQGWDSGNGAIRNTTAHDVAEVVARLGIRPDGTSTPAVHPAAPRLSADATAKAIYAFLLAHGATPAGACAVLGNVQQECSFNNYEVETNGQGVGIIQWSFGRKAAFLAAAAAADIAWQDLGFQLGFMLHELTTDYQAAWAIITTATDPYAAAIDVHRIYEGSGDTPEYVIAHRAIPARDWFAKLAPQPATPPVQEEIAAMFMYLRLDKSRAVLVTGGRQIGLDADSGNFFSANPNPKIPYYRDVTPAFQAQMDKTFGPVVV